VTDPTGAVVEAEDFPPYGGIRMDTKTNYSGVRNKYAGTVYDALSGLNYVQARYQNSSRGQFISEDPIFLGDPRQQTLTDPQSFNAYGYANDNPISKSDPSGLSSSFTDIRASLQSHQAHRPEHLSVSLGQHSALGAGRSFEVYPRKYG